MKKILAYFITVVLIFLQIPQTFAKDELPDLPSLPDFDEVIPPDNLDVFAPATTPSQVVQQKTTAKTPIQNASSQKSEAPKNVSKTTVTTPPKTTSTVTTPQKASSIQSVSSKSTANTYVVPKGKKFKVRLQQSISDKTPQGTRISFISIYPETSTYITIPAGTVFKGKISDTHPPQITGNGGLIVINVDQMVYRGRTYEINAKVSIANDKRIFLNNIKGQRQYFQSIPKALKPGTKYFKKMWKVTCKLAQNDSGVEVILTPFSLLTGTVVYAVNLVTSPVLALFYKGKSITIPKDSPFTIQLREDAALSK